MNPVISVIVANYNGERFLAEALRSILAQSFGSLEIILADDHSTDSSLDIAEAIAAQDARLKILRLAQTRGPAAARNAGIQAAKGTWIAIADSDDFVHPDRFRRLLAAAECDQADIIADDQIIFDNENNVPPQNLLNGALASAPSWITTAQYINANRQFSKTAALGYLKPMIRASLLARHQISYNETLQNSEDYDLILRLLTCRARFRLLPDALYFYRRHSASLSHRLAPGALAAMLAADTEFRHWAGPQAIAPLRAALAARRASLHTAQAVETAIAGLKAHAPRRTLAALLARPSAILPVARVLARRRQRHSQTTLPQAQKMICVLSRQRLIEGTNGSTAYLLSLCRTLRASGFRLQLVCPSPAVLGRIPILRAAGADVFETIAIRGTFRIGGIFIARDPRIFAQAALAVADRLANRLGITALKKRARPAPYAVAQPWAPEDFLFVAQATGGTADIVLADYAYLTAGIPYAARPGAACAVLMHDLLSSRPDAFARLGTADSVSPLDARREANLLAQAGLVIAIQPAEAESARAMLPENHHVVTAPMAITPVPAPQPGEGGGLLFVGSGTAPNVDAMGWFLTAIWPPLTARHPSLTLTLAGGICGHLGAAARQPGITLRGRVADLAPLYRQADIVISPLRAGSGLKIKLVEALGHGKPIIATSVTAQGVAPQVTAAMMLADTADSFAAAILHLLANPQARAQLATAALAAAQNFAPKTAYADVIAYLHARHLPAPTAPLSWVATTEARRTAPPAPFITIVVPTLNEARYIEPCLTSLVSQCGPGGHEILVMDGGSTDSTRAIVASMAARHPAITLHHNPKRLQSAALNLAARLAAPASTIMIRADAHAHYSAGFVKNCVTALRATGATSVVVPMFTRALPGRLWQTAIAAAQSSRLGNGGAAHRTRPVSGFIEHGHHAAFDLPFFRAIGGYDETFTHNEDAELDIRAAKAVGRIWMCGDSAVIYHPRHRLDHLATQYYRHGGGRALTLRKHQLRPRLRQMAPLGALAGCAAGLAAAPFAPADAALALLYPLTCLSWGALAGIRQREPRLALAGLALMTMHLAWALGFLAGLQRLPPPGVKPV